MKVSEGQERERKSRRVKGSREGLGSKAGGEQEEGRQGRQEKEQETSGRGEQEKKKDGVRTASCKERRGVKCKDREYESRGHREEGVT